MRCEGRVRGIQCMTACGDVVISGHDDGCLRVWNTALGRCDHVLRGHTRIVSCISSRAQYLVSGSWDKTIKVWEMGGPGSWPCLGTIAVHTDKVRAIGVWEGRVISGSNDKKISVHDIVTRQHEATVDAHIGPVNALAVTGGRLYSTGYDGTIGVWALGTFQLVRRVLVSEHVHGACIAWP